MTTQKPLAGKTAVVTGAGRGIGRAVAARFAKAGANLALCARTEAELAQVSALVKGEGVRCMTRIADLADPAAAEAFCRETLAEFEQIHVLVNNAGAYLERSGFAESAPDLWWKTVEVNVRGPYLITRHLLSGLADGAKIINLSSGKGMRGGGDSSAYHVSKAGLNMLSEALANELWPRRIDVNILVPGPTATSTFNRDAPGDHKAPEQILAKFSGAPPPGLPAWERLKHPDEVADMALYLATTPDGGPTGQVFSLARRPL